MPDGGGRRRPSESVGKCDSHITYRPEVRVRLGFAPLSPSPATREGQAGRREPGAWRAGR